MHRNLNSTAGYHILLQLYHESIKENSLYLRHNKMYQLRKNGMLIWPRQVLVTVLFLLLPLIQSDHKNIDKTHR